MHAKSIANPCPQETFFRVLGAIIPFPPDSRLSTTLRETSTSKAGNHHDSSRERWRLQSRGEATPVARTGDPSRERRRLRSRGKATPVAKTGDSSRESRRREAPNGASLQMRGLREGRAVREQKRNSAAAQRRRGAVLGIYPGCQSSEMARTLPSFTRFSITVFAIEAGTASYCLKIIVNAPRPCVTVRIALE